MTYPFLACPKIVTTTGLDTVEESTDSIISTMKAFGIESDSTMGIVDRFNEVGNNFAITSAGIGEALQRSASALYAAGNTIDESIGLVTAANSVIQNPEQVGTALKTLSLRIRGVKTELEDAGLETEGMAATTAQLQEKLKALTHGKVDIMLNADEFKNTTQVLREMSAAWEDMTDIERAAALELLGGKRQANILASVITNFETVEEVIETSMNSSGSAMVENAKWLDSIEGKSEQLTNAMQALWNETINSDAIKFFLDLGLSATELVDKIGMLPSALAAVAIYFTAFKKNNPVTLFKDMALHAQNYQQVLAKMQALKSLNLNVGTAGAFDTNAVNVYATAVAGLTAKKQAEMLATSGLNKMQIAEVMRRNEIEEAVIRETLSKMNLKNTTQSLTAATVADAISIDMAADKTQEKAIADFLAANGSKKLTLELIQQAVAQGTLTAEQAAGIIANNKLAFSWKALGASIKTAFMSNPVGWIMMIVSGITMFISKIKQAKEEVVEAAQQTTSAYSEAQKTLREQKATIDELSSAYERLSKGVDLDTNDNISLTTDSYQEYLDICNNIADMYPNLVTGFDAQGNAILSLKGNVDELVQSYKDAAQTARQQMIAGGGDIFSTFKSTYSSDASTTLDSVGIEQKIKLAEEMQRLINEGTEDEINTFFGNLEAGTIDIDGQKYSNVEMKQLFKDAGIKVGWNNMPEFMNSWDGSIDVDKFKQQSTKLLSYIKSATNQINTETSKVKSLMDAYLGEDLDYAALSNRSRAMIDQVVSGLDAGFINSFDTADALYNWIKTNIVDAFKDQSIVDAINELSKLQLEFNAGDISYSDYLSQLNEHISQIQNKVDEDALAQIKIGVGIDEKSLQAAENHIQTLLYGQDFVGPIIPDIQEKINNLSIEDLQIAGQLEVPEGTILSWEELTTKIEAARIAATQDFDITNYTDAVSAHSAAISEYQEALQSLDKGSFTMDDFMGLIKKYPELAKGVDISSNAFHGLSRNLSGAIRTSTKNFVKDLKNLRAELVAAGKSTDSIDQLINAIENMSSDALDNTIQKYSTLADKINEAKQAQDKLSASMEENPNEGYETRGEALDYMKEAMKKGEIGSESNLWNVAEKYGFTYDSAKTINENADALAKFIAIREKWFKEEDDGDDRTKDGYSYKGTEGFIKDVESAVKNDAELQKYLIWDYDESAGTLSFDYKNEDWDTIVSILSKTKQLAGLTSDEFADLMIQVGQYFGIEWGNYDDILDHLNKIATGSSDAKTKVEEYGKSMQDYFGEDTTIDLTTRPMVKFDSTNFKEWEKLYQEIINNPDGHSEADVKNAKEQLASIQKGDSYATVYSSTFSNDDGTKSVVVTPILPDGKVLSPEELKNYAEKLLAGEEIDPNVNIKLAEFEGTDSIDKAGKFAQALHEAQAEYDTLRDTLSINTTIDEKGIEGLKEIKEIQNSISTKADGTIVINEDTFREALEGAQYTEEQIELIIDKINKLNSEAFIPFKVSDALETKGIAGLKEINELQGAIKEDADTGLTVFDTDMFTSVLQEAGYTKTQIDELIKKIQEYNNIVSVSGNTDPLGLNSAGLSIDRLKASLSTLGIEFSTSLGKWFDGKTDLDINVQDMVSALKAKGWTDEAIKEYMIKLSNANLDGFRIDVKTDQIDAALEKANEVPEEKETDYEVIGTGVKTLKDIDDYWKQATKDKTTNYTINKTTIETTKKKGGFFDSLFGSSDDDIVYENRRGGLGTVFASGTGSAPRTETALTGELGPEILVRNGRWHTVGENGAEFTQVKKGDIIFNHQQSKELLSKGYVASRGKAYASGTAYASGGGTFASYQFYDSGGYKQYDVNDKVVESWGDVSGAIDKASKSASDAKDEFEDTFDWVEVRLEEINEQLDLMNAKLENSSTYMGKNSIIDQMIGVNETKMVNLTAGIKKYSDYAARLLADVPAQYRDAAKDGAISITEFAGEADEKTVEAIENYREWAQKVADLNQQLEETKTEIRDLAIQKFDNVYEAGKVRATVEDSQTEKLQNAVDYDEARGLVSSDAYYIAMMENSNKKIEYLTSTRNNMQKELDNAVKSGEVARYSNEWYELVDQMYQVDAEIDEATIELEEYQNAINDLHWDNFDELINRLGYLSDETQNLIDLMEDCEDVVDENGDWTDEGITSLGLYAQQMEIAEYTARQYSEAIDDLNRDYKLGKYSESEYLEKLNELKDAQYDSIQAYYEAQDAIVDLNKARVDAIKDGIQKEIDAYEELIKKKKEELSAEKDLYDFQQSVEEQHKNIADIERKLAALSVDHSASATAKKRQLEAELAEARADLEDSYYDRSVENQQNALDKELEDYKNQKDAQIEELEGYLDNVEQVVADSLTTVQTNASTVYDTLTDKANEYNLTLSDSILTPWRDGALAVSDYQTTFDTAMSSTTEQLDKLKGKWQAVVDTMALAGSVNVAAINRENETYIAAKKEEPKPAATNKPSNTNSTSQTKAPPSVGSTVTVKKSATHFSKQSGNAKMASFVPGGSYKVMQVGVNGDKSQILIGKNGQYTGWVWLKDIQGYAKGTTGVDKDQLAWIDEMGLEELVMHAGPNGRLQYLSKGTSVLNSELTNRIMDLAMNPQDVLDRNRPEITPSKSVVNNNTEIHVDASVGNLIHIDHFDGNNPDEITKIVNKTYDKKIQELNNSLKKFVR